MTGMFKELIDAARSVDGLAEVGVDPRRISVLVTELMAQNSLAVRSHSRGIKVAALFELACAQSVFFEGGLLL
jgi:hypothetical protein